MSDTSTGVDPNTNQSPDDSGQDSAATEAAQAPTEQEQFEQEQALAAQAQNVPEGGVAEQRPQSFLTQPQSKSELTQKIEDASPDTSAMGKEAYDRADSDKQKKAARKESKAEGIMVANVIRVDDKDSPHDGRVGAVNRIVSFNNDTDRLTKATGDPEQLYIQPREIEVRFRGDERDGEIVILNLNDTNVVKVPGQFRGTGRG